MEWDHDLDDDEELPGGLTRRELREDLGRYFFIRHLWRKMLWAEQRGNPPDPKVEGVPRVDSRGGL
jgi:hypothetical protein